jgi:ribokinase
MELDIMSDILVVGSLNMDLVVRAPRFPAPGETISGEDLAIIPGGKGANQAVAAARLGADVSMLGRVGSDVFGQALLDNLSNNQVDVSRVQRDSAATGTATIIVDAHGQNSIVLSPGANGKVMPADVADLPEARILILQFEIPPDAVFRAAQLAREKGMRVIVNPAPARKVRPELLKLVDILVPNESELSLLTGTPVNDSASAEAAARLMIAQGAGMVIVTRGEHGSLTVTPNDIYHVPAFQVDVIDTTAAGDAFIGGLAVSLAEDKPIREALTYANACGALATTKFGAQPSLPTRDEVQEFLNIHRKSSG